MYIVDMYKQNIITVKFLIVIPTIPNCNNVSLLKQQLSKCIYSATTIVENRKKIVEISWQNTDRVNDTFV